MEMCNYIGKHVSYQIACLPALFTINSLLRAASLSDYIADCSFYSLVHT